MDRGHARHVGDVERVLRELVAELDPDAVALCDALPLWETYDRVERLAASAKLMLARRVEEAGTWKCKGFHSAAEQLATSAGTSVSASRSMLDTSKHVADQPEIERALRLGELSMAKAELVSSAVSVAPDEGDRLVELAKTAPVAKVKEASLRAKASSGRDETHARIRRERLARHSTVAEGAWDFHARG